MSKFTIVHGIIKKTYILRIYIQTCGNTFAAEESQAEQEDARLNSIHQSRMTQSKPITTFYFASI